MQYFTNIMLEAPVLLQATAALLYGSIAIVMVAMLITEIQIKKVR